MSSVREDEITPATFADRWGKNLIGTNDIPTQAGFNLGVAEYHATEFEPGNIQEHDDQEALYILSGEGEIQIGDDVHVVNPGTALYVPPHTRHCARCTGGVPLRLVYTHGAV
ncbi:MAG: cupin domain-containing protein [Candidatus Latescibacteria bacterium]|jgi:mannose-6-phosphate isomerase-like protein (cupin superfamily)|nr:cupin domain-containing protein [Candidatus Latescibacterota bacterium]MBT4139276.1 cupin domain-containing protein [Candidatus Latescibacterota bacterium]MBT5830708.1 cupin domain-containing protein [Candidatus Latescibacterota bacterium]